MDDCGLAAARENLIETYWRLGLAAGPRQREQVTPYRLITAIHPLSVSNMACDFHPAAESVLAGYLRELKDIARRNRTFRIFAVDGDPVDIRPVAHDLGFAVDHELSLLWGRDVQPADADLRLAEGDMERRRVAEFMLDQFPTRRDPVLRGLIIRANVGASNQMFYRGDLQEPEGALMISESSQAVGLYNLCVSRKLRGRGLGKLLVQAARSLADSAAKPLVLQSDQNVLPFYARQGCVHVGQFHALYLRPFL